eukprot:11059273-Ditylum_brightwellii.AAC.1
METEHYHRQQQEQDSSSVQSSSTQPLHVTARQMEMNLEAARRELMGVESSGDIANNTCANSYSDSSLHYTKRSNGNTFSSEWSVIGSGRIKAKRFIDIAIAISDRDFGE